MLVKTYFAHDLAIAKDIVVAAASSPNADIKSIPDTIEAIMRRIQALREETQKNN